MSKNIETRIEQLEDRMNYSDPPCAIVYIEGSKTPEEAKAEFKKQRGFDFPENGKIIKIVPYDGRKKPQQSTPIKPA